MPQCQATTNSGSQCQNDAQEGSDYCYIKSHSDVNDCENAKDSKHAPYQSNHQIIVSKYLKLLNLQERAPTLKEVAKETGFHINTVWQHVNDMDLSDHVEISGARALTQDVIMGVAEAAKNGSSANAKLFMQIVHNWSEKKQLDHTSDGEQIDGFKVVRDES